MQLNEIVMDAIHRDFNESIADDRTELSQKEQQFMDNVKNTVELNNGHYCIALPFKDEKIQMPNNKPQVEQRAFWLKQKLQKKPKFYADYKAFVENLIQKGYARKVPPDRLDRHDGKVWYIPHHGVYHPHKPDKIRVVFDCTSKYKEAMFYQVRVAESNIDCLRFLWSPDSNLEKDPEEYQMLVHLFGATSSPSCSNYALLQTAEDNKDDYEAEVINTVKRNFYVDDCLKFTTTAEHAITLAHDLRELLSKGGFHLTKWSSNSRKVLQSIPSEERAKEVKDLDLNQDKLPIESIRSAMVCRIR